MRGNVILKWKDGWTETYPIFEFNIINNIEWSSRPRIKPNSYELILEGYPDKEEFERFLRWLKVLNNNIEWHT